MIKKAKWTNYLWLSLCSFLAFMLEIFSIFVIEMLILNVDIGNYTPVQRSVHCIITACLWLVFIILILSYSRRRYSFPKRPESAERIAAVDWLFAGTALICCKVLTVIDWHTLKIIGESKGKELYQITTQYVYYLFEVGLVLLIIIYGQKAAESLLGRECEFPFGGIVLAVTWGAFHFVSRGVGIEVWNGVSCILFSMLGGIMYVKVKRRYIFAYLLLAIGYLL